MPLGLKWVLRPLDLGLKPQCMLGGSGFKSKHSMASGARAKMSSSTEKVDKKIWTRNENESRIDCIIRRLEECGNDPKLITYLFFS